MRKTTKQISVNGMDIPKGSIIEASQSHGYVKRIDKKTTTIGADQDDILNALKHSVPTTVQESFLVPLQVRVDKIDLPVCCGVEMVVNQAIHYKNQIELNCSCMSCGKERKI